MWNDMQFWFAKVAVDVAIGVGVLMLILVIASIGVWLEGRKKKMSDNAFIRYVRLTPSLNKVWDKLEADERRKVLEISQGETWHLDEVFSFVLEERVR